MSYKIDFTKKALDVLTIYKKSNPTAFKKLYSLISELEEHPRIGTGHPEALKNGNSVTYSRRIKGKDRLIYDVYDDTLKVVILSIEGHYNDK